MVSQEQDMSDYHTRFSGVGRLYGVEAMARLRRAHACVVGVGGVGAWTVEALARSGVGAMTLIDLDDVCVSNTNRQLHAMDGHVGMQKVDVMAERIRRINPECCIHAISDFFTKESAKALLDTDFDVVVDAIDDLQNKCLLLARCRTLGTKVVTVGGAGGRRDPSQVKWDDLSRSGSDGLLRHVRKKLRHEYGFTPQGDWGIPCVFTAEKSVYPTPEGGVCDKPAEGMNLKLDCSSGFGTVSFVTGTFGFLAAARAIELMLDV